MKNKNMQQIVLARPSKLPNRPQRPENKTQSQLVWSFESQSRVKVKVVKWCRKKWFDHNLMYIYHKQCEIMQKNQWNTSNGQLYWYPFDFLWKWSIMDQNYANANTFFSVANKILRYLWVCHMCFLFPSSRPPSTTITTIDMWLLFNLAYPVLVIMVNIMLQVKSNIWWSRIAWLLAEGKRRTKGPKESNQTFANNATYRSSPDLAHLRCLK